MNQVLHNIEPKEIWAHFSLINAIPRASKKEEAISNFMISFANKLGLEVIQDKALNILIKKKASPGLENLKKVTLQSHLDMVHQKNSNTIFDFDTQGIEMYIDGDWVKAKGTTLGADNGLGVATMMTILASKNIEHPELEALFTIDEETGMTGAFELKPGFISGDILLNLDTEEDDEITIGCAGGIDVTAQKKHELTSIKANSKKYKVSINGLQGGHSGVEIHKGLANSNKILNRALYELNKICDFQIISFEGGNLRNAIPREAQCIIATNNNNFVIELKKVSEEIIKEWITKEKDIQIISELLENDISENAISKEEQNKLLQVVYACYNGVYTLDANIPNLVATSNNLASISLKNGETTIACLTRSSIESEKKDLVNNLKSTFNLGGFKVYTDGEYPGWQPNPNASIITTMDSIYTKLFNAKPNINACHAGLECGIIGKPYPNMEMVSFGPTIRGAHSPDERASISSTQKFWEFLKEILKNIPQKENL